MTDDVHPYCCPACETTIRATNVEWLYADGDNGTVVNSNVDLVSEFEPTDDREQLWYCPNDDCRIERLLPGDNV